MKKWTDDFLTHALDGLPKDKYRARAKAELTDHLLELCADLESGGYSPEEAQTRALEFMGDPVELNPSFREAWVRRASNWKYCLVSFLKAGLDAVLVNTYRLVICNKCKRCHIVMIVFFHVVTCFNTN